MRPSRNPLFHSTTMTIPARVARVTPASDLESAIPPRDAGLATKDFTTLRPSPTAVVVQRCAQQPLYTSLMTGCFICGYQSPIRPRFNTLPFGRLWYGEPNAFANAVGYAMHRSRSHRAVIRVTMKLATDRNATSTRAISKSVACHADRHGCFFLAEFLESGLGAQRIPERIEP